jgi:hypothetical protein
MMSPIRKNNSTEGRPSVRLFRSDDTEVSLATPESKVKKQVVLLLESYGAYHFFPAMGTYGRAGIPDIVACCNGKFIGIECKAGDNKTTELQRRELRKIQEAGGYSLVIRESNLDELKQILIHLTGNKGPKHEPKPKRHLRLCDAPAEY